MGQIHTANAIPAYMKKLVCGLTLEQKMEELTMPKNGANLGVNSLPELSMTVAILMRK
jgi:hypothetical protein